MRLDIAGVLVDNVTNQETLDKISEFVKSGQPHYIVTTYSEFVVEADRNEKYRQAINGADLSVPDGIGIVWAAKFLSMPKKDPAITFLNWLGSLGSIVLAPRSVRAVIREQVTGSRLIWDIARIAEQNGFSIALVGGEGGVAERTGIKLKQIYPSLKVNLAVSDRPFDVQMANEISASNSDILLIAYQPPRQELWIADNFRQLNVKVAIGLGGTFDYAAGKRQAAPDFMHYMGLEWLWRLVTQPWRIRRMWNALGVFSWIVLNYKLRE